MTSSRSVGRAWSSKSAVERAAKLAAQRRVGLYAAVFNLFMEKGHGVERHGGPPCHGHGQVPPGTAKLLQTDRKCLLLQ